MSAIAGVCTRDRQPVDSTILPRMLDQLAMRGPHSQGQWSDGPVGLAHRLLQTTPESLKERQPVSDARGECWLIWDGRLDNRDELIRLLKNDGFTLGAGTDPELMLAAFRKWGIDCFRRILGDFALALWDSRTKRLVCARDPIGVKPFYYHLSK
ncbi:MAG: asparagine synthetase B, partial [Nitrospirae bacterium]|nr:asparagine synthetase B [Nitrospirota bacterium]